MSSRNIESILNNVLLAFQLCLGLWQFMKLTPVGALIQGVIGWLLRPVRLSPTYTLLQHCHGRVFKRVDCFTLQADVPAERRGIMGAEVNEINLQYLGIHLLLKKRRMAGDMLSIKIMETDGDMLPISSKIWKEMQTLEDVSINSTIWQELQTLEEVLLYGIVGPPTAGAADSAAAADDRAAADNARTTLFVKCNREFWAEVITGEITTLNEVLDAVIRHNNVVVRLNNEWFLPVNLSEEKLLKILNLVALILHTKKVHWLIPTSLSFISAVMEFSTLVRVWVYTVINVFINVIWEFLCDPSPSIEVLSSFVVRCYSLIAAAVISAVICVTASVPIVCACVTICVTIVFALTGVGACIMLFLLFCLK